MTDSSQTEPAAAAKTPGTGLLAKRNVVVAGLLAAGVVLLAVTRTWVTVAAPTTGVELDAVSVSGTDAASAVLALAVVALVCSLATTITGPVARWIIGAIQVLVGTGVIGFTVPVLGDPATASSSKTAESFGLERLGVGAYELSLWPWVAMIGGALICVMAVVMLVAGRNWKHAKRFERHSSGHAVVTPETMDDVDRWDAFTDGDDPTDGDVRGARFH